MLKFLKTDFDWKLAKNECRNTVNKNATDKEPTREFIHRLIISEHSPLRVIHLVLRFEGIKSWVATHFVRHHEGVTPWVSTQRTDRTGVDRDNLPQGALVNIDIETNGQSLINISRVRLCYQASKETREQWQDVKVAIKEELHEPEMSDAMVPNCVYRCGCPEFSACGFFEKFKMYAYDNVYNMTNIDDRYKAYNEYFYSHVVRRL